jgi:hypothetical protein
MEAWELEAFCHPQLNPQTEGYFAMAQRGLKSSGLHAVIIVFLGK